MSFSVKGPNLGRDEPHKKRCSVCGWPAIDTRTQAVGQSPTDTGNHDGTAKRTTTMDNADALSVTKVARADATSLSNCPFCNTNNFIEGSNKALAI